MIDNYYSNLTPEEKKADLFLRQKRTLDLFLEWNAISKVQYDKSLGDLIEKMQIDQGIVQGVLPESRTSKQGMCTYTVPTVEKINRQTSEIISDGQRIF